ncbi:DNA-binding transcriptional regulator, GntR family [Nonomuraea solani]|uniref:DNA-binding transcriptional regulator, GntR family n=1 Tax=Nonomuraea solani TaxID=1144553 RepID=A0A1H6EZL9_9ACTN|nr:GntR family transcriptional regulator [Nonomuraea solani]SEH03242.1 DNA-binding transcriptional regulator, GntR family [Nonomuraea solani]
MAERPGTAGAKVAARQRRPRAGSGESLGDQAYAHIRGAILQGRYRPNQRLPEDELATELSSSRTPVRVALMRLVDQGLVIRERQGWVVREHTPDEIREIYEVRCALESMATGLAAVRATDEQLATIAAFYDGDIEEFVSRPRAELGRMNRDFHHTIVQASGNGRLLGEWLRNRDFGITYNMAVLFTRDEVVTCVEGHWRIVEALSRRDRAEAERQARIHVEDVQAASSRRLDDLQAAGGLYQA